jgi:ABC-type Na+ efflux pump permease subunit
MKKILFLIAFIVIVISVSILIGSIQFKTEKDLAINFIVYKIETTPALRVILFDEKGNKLKLQRFVFFDRDSIQQGDIIRKDKGSEVLRVFRKDSLGIEKLYLQLPPN